MALPPSGTMSMNDIRVELGVPAQSPFDIDTARVGGYVPLNPYSPTTPPYSGTVSIASWYSYCQTCTPLYSHNCYLAFNSHGALEGWATYSDACADWGTYPLTVYSSSSTLTIGSTLYELYGSVYYPLTLIGFGPGYWIYDADNNQAIDLNNSESNTINDIVPCTGPTYYYYNGSQYLNCFPNGPTNVIRSSSPLTLSWVCGSDGYQYLIGDPVTGPSYDTDAVSEWTTCADATCS
jgi:hypothetical protein